MIHNYILKTITKYVYYSGIVKSCFFMEKHHHPELLSKVECCTTIKSSHRWSAYSLRLEGSAKQPEGSFAGKFSSHRVQDCAAVVVTKVFIHQKSCAVQSIWVSPEACK